MAFAAGQNQTESYQISENASAKQFFIYKQGTTLKSALIADTEGEVVVGILQDTGLDGSSDVEHGDVAIAGESRLKIGGTVAVDDPLMTDTSGQGIKGTATNHVFARALEAGVTGDLIRCIISSEGIF